MHSEGRALRLWETSEYGCTEPCEFCVYLLGEFLSLPARVLV
jgi:hypothetical protein